MSIDRELLEVSRDDRQDAADYNKRQAMLSLALVGSGAAATAIGSVASFEGEPIIGIPGIIIGAGIFITGFKLAKNEISEAMNMQAEAAVRQLQIDSLDTHPTE